MSRVRADEDGQGDEDVRPASRPPARGSPGRRPRRNRPGPAARLRSRPGCRRRPWPRSSPRGDRPLRPAQPDRQDQGGLSFFRREVGVPGAQGQPVGLADEGQVTTSASRSRSAAIFPMIRTCWASFAPKKAQSGRDDIEKLEDDGRHTPEMPGPGLAAEPVLEAADFDVGPVAGGIDLRGVGIEEAVDARLLQVGRVFLEVPRVFLEVLVRPELGGIDEDADDGDIGPLFRFMDEAEVSLVEVAHGRDEPDPSSLPSSIAGQGPSYRRRSGRPSSLRLFPRPGRASSARARPRPRA